MTKLLRTSSGKRFLLLFLIFLISTDLSIFLNIPVFRQVLGFFLLTFIPGLLILYIMKLHKLRLTEKIVLSVGLSISFSMFAGLLINSVYPLFGYNTPLSTNSLIISFSVILLILATIAYLRNRETSSAKLSDFRLNTREKAFLLLPAFFPLLSLLGMRIMNGTDNNVILMALLFLIPAYAIFIAVKQKQVPDRIYPPMIFLTSISLVLLLGLRSNHIIGADTHTEYYLFQQTFHNGQWQILLNNPLDSSLSISVLPTIYQSFLNINSEYLFKILYPILFSISPLAVYLVSKKYIGHLYAFLASLFFMSQIVFLSTTANSRTNTAILFFALSIMVLFHSKLTDFNKRLLFIVFAASSIVSHYSTTYIFLFILLLTWIGMEVILKIPPYRRRLAVSSFSITQSGLKKGITILAVAIFFAMLFFWYSQVAGATFKSGVNLISNTLRNLLDFFILESRGEGIVAAFGVGLSIKTIPQQITFVFSWLTIAFIAIGVLTTLIRNRHTVAFSHRRERKTLDFLSQKIDAEFFILSLVCCTILVAAVALPYVFIGYGMGRAYFQMMVVLSPFFVIGGIMVTRFLRAKRAYLLILVVLIPYFMSTTGTMYQVFGVSQAITLNSEGQQYDMMFVHDQETFAASWLEGHTQESSRIYTDFYGSRKLKSQGGILSSGYMEKFILEHKPLEEGYIYLGYYSVVGGKLAARYHQWYELVEYQDEFAKRCLIYTNGGSEIWK